MSLAVRCRKTGVRYINPHVTGKTCGTLLAALDVHPRVAMRILRHSKIAVTMEGATILVLSYRTGNDGLW